MFDIMHKNTQGLHYDGKNRYGQRIIIDAAEITPGRFEVMAMFPGGRDFDCVTVGTVEEAKKAYKRMVKQYTKPEAKKEPQPLTGKYAKLRDDLKKALEAGRNAEAASPDDGGTCNFDAAAIDLPRWRESLIQQAAQEAGTHCFDWVLWGHKSYVFSPDTRGQANARSRNAEAMTAALKAMGYDAHDYCQMD